MEIIDGTEVIINIQENFSQLTFYSWDEALL